MREESHDVYTVRYTLLRSRAERPMKTASVRDARSQFSDLIHGNEAVIVTSHGKATAVLYPLSDPEKVPMEVRKDVFFAFSQKMAHALKAKGVSEEDVLRGFADFKKRRRGR